MKKIISILLIMVLVHPIFADEIWIKPQFNYSINQDKVLQDYFMKDGFLSYGISGDLIFENNFGVFVDFSSYNFDVEEDLFSKIYSTEMKGKWLSIGLIKRINFNKIPLANINKIGPTFHLNSFTSDTFSEKPFSIGILIGSELSYSINKYLNIGLFCDYNYTKNKIEEYVTNEFSRHCYYLSGKEVNDPHFTFGANLAVKVW